MLLRQDAVLKIAQGILHRFEPFREPTCGLAEQITPQLGRVASSLRSLANLVEGRVRRLGIQCRYGTGGPSPALADKLPEDRPLVDVTIRRSRGCWLAVTNVSSRLTYRADPWHQRVPTSGPVDRRGAWRRWRRMPRPRLGEVRPRRPGCAVKTSRSRTAPSNPPSQARSFRSRATAEGDKSGSSVFRSERSRRVATRAWWIASGSIPAGP